jgi:peptidyl-tRNA hydrolase
MYVIVNASLSPGNQLAQAVHAAFEFGYEHPNLTDTWVQESNYLVVLAAPDEESLLLLTKKADEVDLPYTITREPDFNDQVTAIALAPGLRAQKICAQLPLALKEDVLV